MVIKQHRLFILRVIVDSRVIFCMTNHLFLSSYKVLQYHVHSVHYDMISNLRVDEFMLFHA